MKSVNEKCKFQNANGKMQMAKCKSQFMLILLPGNNIPF